ncbi:MAG: PucR family transcriptional regulator [Thermomicrobiales bacterium]
MTSTTATYERIAGAVAARAAELLDTPVAVTDAHGIIVASSQQGLTGLPYEMADRVLALGWLRVPLRCNEQVGEVILAEPRAGASVPPHLAEAIIELTIGQTTVVEQLPNQHELKNKVIDELLHGIVRDETAISREAKILGMDLGPPRAVLLIDATDFIARTEGDPARGQRQAQRLIESVVRFFKLPSDTICAHLSDGEVAVLKASNSSNLDAWAEGPESTDSIGASWANLTALKRASTALLGRLRADTGSAVQIGIGRYHPGLRGLALSYEDARAALSLGRRLQSQRGVHCLDDLGIAAFVGVADEATKVALALHLLSPLDHEPELLATLDAFFAADCCPSATASRLAIHRNTLGYRLSKIAALTGLDPRHFDAAVLIRLALVLRVLHHPPASPG